MDSNLRPLGDSKALKALVPLVKRNIKDKLKECHYNLSKIEKDSLDMTLLSELVQMTFGEQNTEKEAHEMLSYAVENGINILDTAEMIILATKVAGYSDRITYLRDTPADVLRVDAANIKESVEKSLKRLNTDYIDLLQIHW
ncbi:NAD(P)-linked oxidoreductase superfamily protein [Tanacetum coccineum]